jgi:hypothetical protein
VRTAGRDATGVPRRDGYVTGRLVDHPRTNFPRISSRRASASARHRGSGLVAERPRPRRRRGTTEENVERCRARPSAAARAPGVTPGYYPAETRTPPHDERQLAVPRREGLRATRPIVYRARSSRAMNRFPRSLASSRQRAGSGPFPPGRACLRSSPCTEYEPPIASPGDQRRRGRGGWRRAAEFRGSGEPLTSVAMATSLSNAGAKQVETTRRVTASIVASARLRMAGRSRAAGGDRPHHPPAERDEDRGHGGRGCRCRSSRGGPRPR